MNDQPANQPGPMPKSPMIIAAVVVTVFVAVVALTADRDSVAPQRVDASQQVQWMTDLTQAAAESASSGRPVFALFTQDQCPPCELMRRDVYPDARIAGLLTEQFVPLKLDMTQVTPELIELSNTFEVMYVPTLIVLDASGRSIARHTGGMTTEQLEKMLRDALSQIASDSHDAPAS
jgi:thiol:disulfide interchange protein